MSSSVPDFGLEARRWLKEAEGIIETQRAAWTSPSSPGHLALVQAEATIALTYAVLAVSRQIAESAPLRP